MTPEQHGKPNHPRLRRAPQRTTSGMALPVVLLFLALILGGTVSTTSMLGVGAARTNTDEMTATNALLAAESGLNAFEARVKTLPPAQLLPPDITVDSINSWLAQRGLTHVTLPNGATATVTAAQVMADGTGKAALVTLRSSGTIGKARKIVLKEYRVVQIQPHLNIPGTLTAYPSVQIKGNIEVGGQNDLDAVRRRSSGYLSDTSEPVTVNSSTLTLTAGTLITQPVNITIRSNTPTATPTVGDTMRPGTYIRTGGRIYRVTANTSSGDKNDLVLRPTDRTATNRTDLLTVQTITKDSAVEAISHAVTSAVTGATPNQLQVINAGNYSVGDRLNITPPDSTMTYTATVTGVHTDTNTLSVTWAPSQPTACASYPTSASSCTAPPIPEGTPIVKVLAGIVTAGDVIDPGKNQEYTKSTFDTRVLDPSPNGQYSLTNNPLFHRTFGAQPGDVFPIAKQLTTQNFSNLSGINYYNGNVNVQGSQGICGTGILIVQGNLAMNSSADCTFRGIIYVMGDYVQGGNLTLFGSIVAEGTVSDTTQDVGATLAGAKPKLYYNALAISRAMTLLSRRSLEPVPHSWRQQ